MFCCSHYKKVHSLLFFYLPLSFRLPSLSISLSLVLFAQVVEGPGVSLRGTHHGSSIDAHVLAALDRRELCRQFLSGLEFLHRLNIGMGMSGRT